MKLQNGLTESFWKRCYSLPAMINRCASGRGCTILLRGFTAFAALGIAQSLFGLGARMGKIEPITCDNCRFASDPFSSADLGIWHFCKKITEKINYDDEAIEVRGEFGCILFRGKKWNTENSDL